MKNYFFYTAVILLFTINFSNRLLAQSTNEKYKALNNYIESIVNDTTANEIFIAKEKINSNTTINILKKDWIYVLNSDGKWAQDKLFFDKKSWEKMKKEHKNKCVPGKLIWCNVDYWTKESFACKKVTLESMNTSKGVELIFEKYNNLDIKVYGFSEPIYYQNKYIIFTVNISGFNSSDTYIIVMKESKNNWIVIHEGRDPDSIN